MQVQKTKQGYKLVKTLFGKYTEIPKEWYKEKLKKTCIQKPEYGANVSAIEKNESLPRYIRITDLNDDGTLRNTEWKSIKEEDAKPYLLKKGDCLFARTGATVGKTYLYREKDGKCAFAGYLIRFKPNNKILNPEFLFYITHSGNYWRWLTSIQTWGVQPNVNAEQYSNMPILLPTINEQQKISSILSNIDSLIQQTNNFIEKTKVLKLGLMRQLLLNGIDHKKFKKVKWFFGKEIEIPEDWNLVTMKEICKVRQGLQIPISERFQENDSNRLKYITVKSIHSNSFDEYIENPGKRVICTEDDILFTRTGNTGEIITNIKGVFHNNFFLIDFDRKIILKEYLVYFLNLKRIQEIIKNLSGTTTIPDLNHGDFFRLLITIPPKKEQQKITFILSNIDSLIKKQEEHKSKLEFLKKGLIQTLLTGKIRLKI